MNRRTRLWIVASVAFLSLAGSADVYAQQSEATFFITSTGSGKGADLGGIAGADQHCQHLAQAAGLGANLARVSRPRRGAGAVNARDRIGQGPLAERQGCRRRQERRRPARPEQHHQADGPDREG